MLREAGQRTPGQPTRQRQHLPARHASHFEQQLGTMGAALELKAAARVLCAGQLRTPQHDAGCAIGVQADDQLVRGAVAHHGRAARRRVAVDSPCQAVIGAGRGAAAGPPDHRGQGLGQPGQVHRLPGHQGFKRPAERGEPGAHLGWCGHGGLRWHECGETVHGGFVLLCSLAMKCSNQSTR
jgi:hypothetical protein